MDIIKFKVMSKAMIYSRIIKLRLIHDKFTVSVLLKVLVFYRYYIRDITGSTKFCICWSHHLFRQGFFRGITSANLSIKMRFQLLGSWQEHQLSAPLRIYRLQTNQPSIYNARCGIMVGYCIECAGTPYGAF
jgi:hypothetical protein